MSLGNKFVIALFVLAISAGSVALAEGEKSFVYKSTPQAELEIHVHYPPEWKESDKRPAIVFFFGGGWNSGRVTQFEPQAKYLASRGMVAVRADYRVKSRHSVTPDACVEDAKSAVRWLRKNAGELGIDPQKIVASGGSAGGHIAACTGTTPGLEAKGEDAEITSVPNALVLFNPVLKLSGYEQLMARIDNDEKLGRALSPTLHVNKNTPPALILFGDADRLYEHGKDYVSAAEKVGATAEVYVAPKQGHGFFNRSPWLERTLQRADEFLAAQGYLEGKPTVELP